MATHSLTHSARSLSHSLIRWRRRHCAKTKLQQKSAARTRNEAECNEQHSAHSHTSTHTIMTREREREVQRKAGLCKYSAAATAAAAVEQVATTLMLQCETFEKFYKSRWTRRRTVGHLTVPQNDSGVAVDGAAIAAMLAVVRLHLELETSLVPRHWKSESTFFYCSRRFFFFRLLCVFVPACLR